MDLNTWKEAEPWRVESAASLFPTPASWRWFASQHRRELVERGVLLTGGGRAKDLVDCARIAAVVLEIRQAKSLARLNRPTEVA